MSSWTPRLTVHEHELLQLAGAGADNRELALRAGTDEPTLRRRLDSLLAKLDADNLAHAIDIARARNIIVR